jgi:hypothetical protein
MRPSLVVIVPLLLVAAACKDKPRVVPPQDAGPLCDGNTQLVNGECRFVCQRDGDCMTGERCNLFLGQCEPKPPEPDAGPGPGNCTRGAVRCSADKKSIETCTADPPVWMTSMTCPPPTGFCQNERCLVCQPGAAQCVAGAPTELSVCLEDGSATRTVTCSGAATCQGNECRECTPNAYRCNPGGTALQQCQKTGDETATWKWVNVGDNFDGACITGQCRAGGGNGFECVPPACFPGQIQCKDMATAQTCSNAGAWQDMACGAGRECQAGVCVDECADAVAARSYFGCDFWTAVQDNGVLASVFKGNVTSGQGAAANDSTYALVVSNRSVNAATVTVTRYFNNALQTVKTVNVPGRNDPATRGLVVVRLPWQSVGAGSEFQSSSGLRRYAYRLQSTKPITLYQFNPLDPVGTLGTCNNVNQCTAEPAGSGQTCTNGMCRYFSYSNDASLLLPAHILGTSYVAMTPEHVIRRSGGATSAPLIDPAGQAVSFNGHITIVATADNTVVTVRTNARTRVGAGVTALDKGMTGTYTLQSYDVLQLASDNPTNVLSAASNIECGDDPFDQSLACAFGSCRQLCRTDNSLTGSIVTADKPIAVFGGSQCSLVGYRDTACDHLEEQMFPFNTWGKDFVATRTPPLRLTNGLFATAASAGPDYYQIVAGCPASQCPMGTLIRLSPPPAAADVMAPNRCASGSLAANTCRLLGGQFMQFRSKTSFTISADQPIAVGQFFAGQDATTGTTRPAEGDPSFVLLPPIEQWRANYTVLTAPGIRDNYVGLVIDSTRVQSVTIDGTAVSTWAGISGTNYQTANTLVSNGTHVIAVQPRAVQPPLPDGGVYRGTPGAGVTVSGFDSYVSYGYTGGLDLQSIVTGINPGG